ncbi:TPA: hypothetical protein ACI4K4_000204 [Enterobacter hormaechei]
MSNIDKIAKRALREAAERAKDNFIPCFRAPTRDVLALLDELEAKNKRIAELEARDINIKQQAQALFEAIANPAEHYVPAYARCLREVLNGTSTAKGE